MRLHPAISHRIPGLMLCLVVTIVAMGLEKLEVIFFGRAWLEALVLAILLGTLIRTLWVPGDRWHEGINFSAKILLEIAVVLLGASISFTTILATGSALLLSIAGVVTMTILISYSIGRVLKLKPRMSILIACGNSICGNSAIA